MFNCSESAAALAAAKTTAGIAPADDSDELYTCTTKERGIKDSAKKFRRNSAHELQAPKSGAM